MISLSSAYTLTALVVIAGLAALVLWLSGFEWIALPALFTGIVVGIALSRRNTTDEN